MYSKCLLEANGHESEAAEIVGGGLRDSLEGEGWLSFLFSSFLFFFCNSGEHYADELCFFYFVGEMPMAFIHLLW
jgi:hypothetical protein